MKAYKEITKQSPLPFLGQKRNWIRELYNYFADKDLHDYVIVDLFGGSGLLANLFKEMFSEATVIYNDYDTFSPRLDNIEDTNRHLHNLRKIIKTKKKKRITDEEHEAVIDYIKSNDIKDKISVFNSLLMSMKVTSFTYENPNYTDLYYNNLRKNDYSNADGYLKGVIKVQKDYLELLKEIKEVYKDNKILLLLDPPYVISERGHYNNRFSIADTLQLIEMIKGYKFVYFNNKEGIELLKHILGERDELYILTKSQEIGNNSSIDEFACINI